MELITIKTLNPHDPELNSQIAVSPRHIVSIYAATHKDKQDRKEVESIVVVMMGGSYATTEPFEELVARINLNLKKDDDKS